MRAAACLVLLAVLAPASVAQTPALTITTPELPPAEVDVPYLFTCAATGGVPPYSWRIDTMYGMLYGLSMIGPTGQFVSTPDYPGTYIMPIKVTDSVGNEARKEFTLVINAGVLRFTTESLPQGHKGYSYFEPVVSAGGTYPKTYAIIGGTLPEGLSFGGRESYEPDQSPMLTGQTTTLGTYQFTVQVTDSAVPPQVAAKQFTLEVTPPPPVVITLQSLATAVTGAPYSQDIWFQGGSSPHTLSSDDLLPEGLYISGFRLAGVGPTQGTYAIKLRVTDGTGESATKTLQLVSVEPVVVTTENLQGMYVGEPFSVFLQATGGLPPYRWATPFALPAGWNLNGDTGEVSGLVSNPEAAHLWVTVTDSSSPQLYHNKLIGYIVRDGHVRITSTSLPPARFGSAYYATLSAEGGTPPHSWSIASGALPPGVELSTGGELTGAPTKEGRYTFEVTARDSTYWPDSTTQRIRISVGPPMGRNNTISSASPLGNGQHFASISPLGAEPDSVEPDVDVYAVTATRGTPLRVETYAQRLYPQSPLDPVIDIVDVNGAQLVNCIDEVRGTNNKLCVNDDLNSAERDSRLRLQLPGSGTQTVYVRVVDWRGDARPDLEYVIEIEGAAAAAAPAVAPRKTVRPRSRVP
jgi:hypothetical protein